MPSKISKAASFFLPGDQEGLPDSSFFAPDCFHFSSKAHAHTASGLWKNMVRWLREEKAPQVQFLHLLHPRPASRPPALLPLSHSPLPASWLSWNLWARRRHGTILKTRSTLCVRTRYGEKLDPAAPPMTASPPGPGPH